jgi:hypothetical protein
MTEIDRRTAPRFATPGSIYMDCRLCWQRIRLEPDRVQILHWEYVYRCHYCDMTFLIREEDAVALGVVSTGMHA